jgi:hypothetical protein
MLHPLRVRSAPYHGWLLRAFLALVVVFLLAVLLSKA